jgi:L-alanine-DL-glutamate epimerase-like enolase superfamily enzyme
VKIIAVESRIVSLPFDMGGPPALFAGQVWDRMEILMVRVETADGLVGWGEGFGHAAISSTRAALDSIVAPLVIGRNSADIEGITGHVLPAVHLLGRNGPFVFAFSGVEIALWDIAGKRAGKPVHALLGDSAKTETKTGLECYASLLRYGTPELAARNTAAACERGYRLIKLHEVTRDAVLACREAGARTGAQIILDVNCAWSPADAVAMAKALRDDGLHWLEEPVWPPEDSASLAAVRRIGIPIAAGENTAGRFGFKTLIEAGAIDIAQPSVTKIGGIGEMLSVIDLCRNAGVTVIPHCPYFGHGLIATLHIIAALAPDAPVEVLWLDMEAHPFHDQVTPVGGRLKAPQGPGLGCEPEPDVMARYTKGEVVRTTAGGRS